MKDATSLYPQKAHEEFLKLENTHIKEGSKASDCCLHTNYIFLVPEARKLLKLIQKAQEKEET